MSFSIQSTALAVEAANLAPAPAVKSTSDTTSAAPGQKQASSHTVSPNAPQESKETQAQTTQEAAHGDASESAREGNFKQVIPAQVSTDWVIQHPREGYAGWSERTFHQPSSTLSYWS
jgi:hypothetical protein